VLGAKLAKVLVDVLVREVATKCDAVDLTVRPGELGQGTVLLPLLDELEESLEIETRRGTTHNTASTHLQRQIKRRIRRNLFNMGDCKLPGKVDWSHQGQRSWPWDTVPCSGAHTANHIRGVLRIVGDKELTQDGRQMAAAP
jgi:hypothetical protein